MKDRVLVPPTQAERSGAAWISRSVSGFRALCLLGWPAVVDPPKKEPPCST